MEIEPIRQDLDLDQGWAIGEDSFRAIVERMRAAGVQSIVEFGSGLSSIRLALELPSARIFSIESNREWYDRVSVMREKHQVDKNLTLSHRALRWQTYAGGAHLSYEPGALPERVDAVLIDGPPTWTRRGREACLYQVMPFLVNGGLIFLDDYQRKREQIMVRNWQRSYPGAFAISTIETGHRVCVLQKILDVKRPRFSARTFRDHAVQVMALMLTHPLRR